MRLRSLVIAAALFGIVPAPAAAHPLGNFTSNHLTRLDVGRDAVTAHYVLDDAEIPTFALLRSLDRDGRPSPAVLAAWAARHAAEIAGDLTLTVDNRAVAFAPVRSSVALHPGAGGLPTLYLTADERTALAPGPHRVVFHDGTLPGKIGWKDVVVAPAREPTDELRHYPDALLGSPRDRTAVAFERSATGAVRVDAAGDGPVSAVPAGRMNDLSGVLTRNLADPLVLLGALLLAIGLGALHAFEPGHGKTLLAVSLVGARATVSQATILAGSLTFAHTFGVFAFGIVILALARYVVPESLYPWIALISGGCVAVLGARALARVLRRSTASGAHGHAHHQHDDHDHIRDQHHDHGHAHEHGDAHEHGHTHAIPGHAPITFREALVAAITGNVAPCPAALVVLLAAIASHQIGYGLLLIVAFSAGLALTLTALGVAVVRGAAWLTRRPQFERFAAMAPLVTAAVISFIGAWMLGGGLAAQGIVASPVVVAPLVLAAIAAYAFLPLAPSLPATLPLQGEGP